MHTAGIDYVLVNSIFLPLMQSIHTGTIPDLGLEIAELWKI